MNYKIYIILILILFGCKTQTKIITVGSLKNQINSPPGTVKISDNFFADIREISNSEYSQFLYWTKRVCGVDNKEFRKFIPDLSINCFENVSDSLLIEYFTSIEFSEYPVVGISLDQAELYSNWRSNRVAEMILINLGFININIGQDCESQFTIEKYLDGSYEAIIKHNPDLVFPKYTIPTIDEWELIAGVNSGFKYGLDSLNKYNKKLLKKSKYLFRTKESIRKEDLISTISTLQYETGYKNIYGLYNIIGNVSELVDTVGISKGGNWTQYLNDIQLDKNTKTQVPNCWTGFRTVCRYQKQ